MNRLLPLIALIALLPHRVNAASAVLTRKGDPLSTPTTDLQLLRRTRHDRARRYTGGLVFTNCGRTPFHRRLTRRSRMEFWPVAEAQQHELRVAIHALT